MPSSVRPRPSKYGCSASKLRSSKPSGLFGPVSCASPLGLGVLFARDALPCFGFCSAFGDSGFDDDLSNVSLNQSEMRMAASRMLTSSVRLTKSRMLPPRLHSPKQFQQFFEMLTRN